MPRGGSFQSPARKPAFGLASSCGAIHSLIPLFLLNIHILIIGANRSLIPSRQLPAPNQSPPPHSFIISFNRLISPMRCFAPGLFLFNQEKKATVIIGEITDFRNLQLWKEFFSKYKNANTKLRLLDSVGTYMPNWTSYIEDGIYE